MAPPERASASERTRLLLATGLGVGYAPIVPGTVGSLLGLVLTWWLALAGWPFLLAACLLTAAVGIWAAEGAARHFGRTDPGPVVIDEIAGQMLTLLFVPISGVSLAAGFVLFRIFDVVKPPPARWLESLPGGSGIMADDLMAAVYANVAVRLVLYFYSA